MGATRKPSRATIGRLAEKSPELLNPLFAFFVMGWRKVFVTLPQHGVDQRGKARVLPNFVGMLGVSACVSYLLEAPDERDGANDVLSRWMGEVAGREPEHWDLSRDEREKIERNTHDG